MPFRHHPASMESYAITYSYPQFDSKLSPAKNFKLARLLLMATGYYDYRFRPSKFHSGLNLIGDESHIGWLVIRRTISAFQKLVSMR